MRRSIDHILNDLFTRPPAIAGRARGDFDLLLDRLGDPHLRLPPTIHVAGTNGKGSTIAFLRAIFEAAGYGVHVYTSPHLLRYHERFVLNGRMVSDDVLLDGLAAVEAQCDGLDLGFVDITAALGFYLFSSHPADILLLETGMGGRLDQTNRIEAPLLSVITTLSYDHTAQLGERIEEIAGEKAGIIKPGTPCIIGHQIYPQALKVARARAAAVAAPLIQVDDPLPDAVRLSLHGAHQRHNAALAVAAIRAQNHFRIDEDHITSGLYRAVWPGRLQPVPQSRLGAGLGPGWAVWLDGAHNDSGAAALSDWIAVQDRPVHLITGMKAGKDTARFVAPLAERVASVTAIALREDGIDPQALSAAWRAGGCRTVHDPAPDIETALARIAARGNAGIILICGSLYLVQMVMPPHGTG